MVCLRGWSLKSEKPLVVLRDTGAAQTVMLNSVLPLSVDTDLHKSVLVECIGDTEYQSLPLHRVCLKSKYVSGDVTVVFLWTKFLLRVYTCYLGITLQVDR